MSFSSFDHFWRDVTNHGKDCMFVQLNRSFAHSRCTKVLASWDNAAIKHVAEGMLAKLTVPAIQHLWFLKLWFGCRFSFFCWACFLSFLGLKLDFALNQRCWHLLALPISSILFIWLAAFASPEHLQMKAVELNLWAPQIFLSMGPMDDIPTYSNNAQVMFLMDKPRYENPYYRWHVQCRELFRNQVVQISR